MTAELRVSVPDDVADWLKQQGDASDMVTEAVRAYMRAAQVDEVLRAAGIELDKPTAHRIRPEPAYRERFAEGRRTLADRPGG